MTNSAKNPLIGKLNALEDGIGKNVFGYTHVKKMTLNAIICGGHVILVSKPGLGKTMLLSSIGALISGCKWWSEQFTADMRPADLKGSRPFNPKTGEFEEEPGPIVGIDLMVADEMNRAQPKTNGVLLRAMQEGFIMIGKKRFDLNDMFSVMAAVNPIEQEGVFNLPEAVMNRFFFELIMGYETFENEKRMLKNAATFGRGPKTKGIEPVISIQEILQIREEVLDITLSADDKALDLVLYLCRATRPDDGKKFFEQIFMKDENGKLTSDTFAEYIKDGVSPRAEIATLRGAAAVAWRAGRNKIEPDDIKHVFRDASRHRLYLTDTARHSGFNPDDFITALLDKVPILSGITS